MPKVTSIRLPDELLDGLDRVARSLDRPRSWVILQALAELDAGTAVLTAHEDVMAELEQLLGAAAGPDPQHGPDDAPHRVA